MITIGIDGGPSGGIVALGPIKGTVPIGMWPMPTIKRDGVQMVDGAGVCSIIRGLHWPVEGVQIWVEDLSRHSMSKAAMRSMALNFGRLVGALEARVLCERCTLHLTPAGNALSGWQRGMLGRMVRGESKFRAEDCARALWPSVAWPVRRSAVNDGIIDAALIAEFGRRGGAR